MIIYVAHSGNAEEVVRNINDFQTKDLLNCYVSPSLTFSHLADEQIGADAVNELWLDLLSIADRLIVVGKKTDKFQILIDFAKLVKMEVMRLEENGELRPFTD